MPRRTARFYLPFVLLSWTLALQHGRARDLLVADATLVSRVSLGSNPTSGFGIHIALDGSKLEK
jgi:hypothetical protein